MTLYSRGEVYWTDFTVKGKRYRYSTGHKVKADAKQWEKDKIAELRGEVNAIGLYKKIKANLIDAQIDFKNAWNFFVSFPRKKTPCEQLKSAYFGVWTDFSLFCNNKNKFMIAEVDEKDAIDYIALLRTEGRFSPVSYIRQGKEVINRKTTKELSPRAVNTYIGTLKLIFNVLVLGKHCLENPFAHIDKLNNEQVDREAFSPEELRIIGEKSKDTWLYPLFLTGICTGLREGDICLLEWRHIKDGWIERITRKTKAAVQIPILPALAAYLDALPRRNEQYCFPLLASAYLRDSAEISKAVKEFLAACNIESQKTVAGRSRKASIKDVHSLRHTFAYIAAVNNIPLPIVQSILGHMSPAMTQKYIAHARKEEKIKFMAQLPDYLSIKIQSAHPTDIKSKLLAMTTDNWQAIRDELLVLAEKVNLL